MNDTLQKNETCKTCKSDKYNRQGDRHTHEEKSK